MSTPTVTYFPDAAAIETMLAGLGERLIKTLQIGRKSCHNQKAPTRPAYFNPQTKQQIGRIYQHYVQPLKLTIFILERANDKSLALLKSGRGSGPNGTLSYQGWRNNQSWSDRWVFGQKLEGKHNTTYASNAELANGQPSSSIPAIMVTPPLNGPANGITTGASNVAGESCGPQAPLTDNDAANVILSLFGADTTAEDSDGTMEAAEALLLLHSAARFNPSVSTEVIGTQAEDTAQIGLTVQSENALQASEVKKSEQVPTAGSDNTRKKTRKGKALVKKSVKIPKSSSGVKKSSTKTKALTPKQPTRRSNRNRNLPAEMLNSIKGCSSGPLLDMTDEEKRKLKSMLPQDAPNGSTFRGMSMGYTHGQWFFDILRTRFVLEKDFLTWMVDVLQKAKDQCIYSPELALEWAGTSISEALVAFGHRDLLDDFHELLPFTVYLSDDEKVLVKTYIDPPRMFAGELKAVYKPGFKKVVNRFNDPANDSISDEEKEQAQNTSAIASTNNAQTDRKIKHAEFTMKTWELMGENGIYEEGELEIMKAEDPKNPSKPMDLWNKFYAAKQALRASRQVQPDGENQTNLQIHQAFIWNNLEEAQSADNDADDEKERAAGNKKMKTARLSVGSIPTTNGKNPQRSHVEVNNIHSDSEQKLATKEANLKRAREEDVDDTENNHNHNTGNKKAKTI